MGEERPLTEFSTDSTSDTESDTEPVAVTYRWRPDTAVCHRCGASTETQWLDDGEFLCPDCKLW